jgi:muramoyltetrapeptide carboxypeptidase
MVKPPSLKPGDRIAIVAPARKVLRNEMQSAIDTLSSWGLEVVLAKNLFSSAHAYLGGTDKERLEDLQECIDDPSIKAIIAGRGGYGSSRIVHKIDFSPMKKGAKWIIGFSDITAIHLKLLAEGFMSIHATMPILFSKPESRPSIESLKKILFETDFIFTFDSAPSNKFGKGSGKMIGGNLSLIADSLGSVSSPDTKGAVLVIEEIDEYIYRLDRMITQLKSAGKLDSLSALIVGHITDLKESESPFAETVEEIVLNAVGEFLYPVIFKFPSGHENPNLAWIHGQEVSVTCDNNCVKISQIKIQSKY